MTGADGEDEGEREAETEGGRGKKILQCQCLSVSIFNLSEVRAFFHRLVSSLTCSNKEPPPHHPPPHQQATPLPVYKVCGPVSSHSITSD